MLLVSSLLAACDQTIEDRNIRLHHQYGNNENAENREQKLYLFITEKLMGSQGIFTNLTETDQNESFATGHEILSESMGLLMRYYAITSQQDRFEDSLRLSQDVLMTESGFSYRYSPKHNKLYTVNAAVDDLRIIRALYEAADIFENEIYFKQANQYADRFMKYNTQNGNMFDFYDEYYRVQNNFITLCYIDLRTLGYMSSQHDQQILINQMSSIIQNGYVSDEFPFYETRYNYETENYQSEDINTIESMLTILSLAEVGLQRVESIDYIKQNVQKGTLYGKYTKEGTPKTDIQSTAIYAIAAMIGSEIGDEELYKQSIERMERYQVVEAGSTLYGAYGDVATLQAYSFDNLQALLAYVY